MNKYENPSLSFPFENIVKDAFMFICFINLGSIFFSLTIPLKVLHITKNAKLQLNSISCGEDNHVQCINSIIRDNYLPSYNRISALYLIIFVITNKIQPHLTFLVARKNISINKKKK